MIDESLRVGRRKLRQLIAELVHPLVYVLRQGLKGHDVKIELTVDLGGLDFACHRGPRNPDGLDMFCCHVDCEERSAGHDDRKVEVVVLSSRQPCRWSRLQSPLKANCMCRTDFGPRVSFEVSGEMSKMPFLVLSFQNGQPEASIVEGFESC